MYSQNELDEAVAAGAISADAANALRAFSERQRSTTAVDEEQFRLITGFNDIFVSVAAVILLVAVGWIGQWVGQSLGTAIEGDGPSFLAPAAVAATSWGLATVLHRQAAHGAALDHPAPRLRRLAVRRRRLRAGAGHRPGDARE